MSKLCPVCGKLISEGFQPLDAIRSSYWLQRRDLSAGIPTHGDELFYKQPSAIAETAWACAVYSMVPYLGILFVPLALGAGGVGYLVERGKPRSSSGISPIVCIGVSLLLLAIQMFLWWLLYLIPKVGV